MTFSYDDGIMDDVALVKLFNDYGIKGTFNLIGSHCDEERMGSNWNGTNIKKQSDIVALYAGHEVSNHSDTHPRIYITDSTNADYKTEDEAIANIQAGKTLIDTAFGTNVRGFVWPFQAADRPKVLAHIAETYSYARPITVTKSFDLPENFLNWEFTAFHNVAKTYYDRFMADQSEDLKLLSIWGHAYEIPGLDNLQLSKEREDMKDRGIYKVFEGVRDNLDTLWSATNIEIVDYVNSLRAYTVDEETRTITNNGTVDIYLRVNGRKVKISPNQHYTVQ